MHKDTETGLYLPFDTSQQDVVIPQGFDGPYSHFDIWKKYGTRRTDLTYAVDFRLPFGSVVKATRDGVVTAITNCWDDFYEGDDPKIGNHIRTNFLIVTNNEPRIDIYAHLSRNGILVKEGQRVQQGQPLAYTGRSGWVGYPHLHYHVQETREGVQRTLPISFQDYQGSLWHKDVAKKAA